MGMKSSVDDHARDAQNIVGALAFHVNVLGRKSRIVDDVHMIAGQGAEGSQERPVFDLFPGYRSPQSLKEIIPLFQPDNQDFAKPPTGNRACVKTIAWSISWCVLWWICR